MANGDITDQEAGQPGVAVQAASRGNGVKRLGIALMVPWVAYWGFQAFERYTDMKNAAAERVATPLGIVWLGQTESAYATSEFKTDLIWMVSAPVAMVLIYWVYRGFKRRA